MKKFKLKKYNSNKNTYTANVLDIWYQNNKVVAYVQGTQIYKTELIIKGNRIENYYCSCPSCNGGMHYCKHLTGVEKYLSNHEIPEIEYTEEKDDLDFNLTTKEILTKFKSKISNFLDEEDCINCYQSPLFSDCIFKYCIYIDNYIDNNELDNAFYLATNFIDITNDIYMYVDDDKEEINEILINYLITLIKNNTYYKEIEKYLLNKYKSNKLDDIGEEILSRIIPTINKKDVALNYINLLKQINVESYLENRIKEYIKELKNKK